MSLIIDPKDWGTYLEGSTDDARSLIRPNLMAGFERVAVSSKVNSVKNDGPEVIEPAEPELPPAQPTLFA